jgi:hypothetical protein
LPPIQEDDVLVAAILAGEGSRPIPLSEGIRRLAVHGLDPATRIASTLSSPWQTGHGHVHEREVLSRDPWIVLLGNFQGRHSRELGGKGATLVDVVDSCVVSPSMRLARELPHYECDARVRLCR